MGKFKKGRPCLETVFFRGVQFLCWLHVMDCFSRWEAREAVLQAMVFTAALVVCECVLLWNSVSENF